MSQNVQKEVVVMIILYVNKLEDFNQILIDPYSKFPRITSHGYLKIFFMVGSRKIVLQKSIL